MVTSITDSQTINSMTALEKSSEQSSKNVLKLKDGNIQIKRDSVKISADALMKQQQENKKAQTSDYLWEKSFGFKDGEFILDNGNKQIVTIEGSKLTIEEYDGDNLIRQVNGDLTSDGAVLSTQIFDKNGKLAQNITTTFSSLSTGDQSSAKITRSTQWYENGELFRTMEDSMKLDSRYLDPAKGIPKSLLTYGTDEISGDMKALAKKPTQDFHSTSYTTHITEFNNGTKSSETHIEQKGSFVNKTNRTSEKSEGIDAMTTHEQSQNSSLEISFTNYDSNGDVLRQASWQDQYHDSDNPEDGFLSQQMNISWYNNGEIVKHEQSSATIEETENSKLPERPGVLEILGISNDDYASKKSPQTASQLLAEPLMESSSKSEFYTENIKNHTAEGDYKSAFMVEKDLVNDRPYEMSWSNETYKDGEIVARQEDKESARKNPLPKGLEFWNGRGLTESESPSTIKRAEHTDSSFEDGRQINTASLFISEEVNHNHDGPDTVTTNVHGTQKKGLQSADIHRIIDGGIENADTDLHAASKKISKAEDLMMDETYDLLNTLDRSNPAPDLDEYNFKLQTTY